MIPNNDIFDVDSELFFICLAVFGIYLKKKVLAPRLFYTIQFYHF